MALGGKGGLSRRDPRSESFGRAAAESSGSDGEKRLERQNHPYSYHSCRCKQVAEHIFMASFSVVLTALLSKFDGKGEGSPLFSIVNPIIYTAVMSHVSSILQLDTVK